MREKSDHSETVGVGSPSAGYAYRLALRPPHALLVTLIAFTGFWPTYFGKVLAGTVSAPLIIHVHAAVFVLWLSLFIAQAVFAATGRRALHVKRGPWLMAYGVLLIAVRC